MTLAASILLVSMFSIAGAPPPCTDEQAYQTPGRWIPENNDTAMADRSFPKASYKTLFTKGDRVIELLKRSLPDLSGIDAKAYHSIRGDSYVRDGAVKFGVTSLFLSYYCVPAKGYMESIAGTIQPGGETGTWIYFNFNSLGWLANEEMTFTAFKTAKGSPILYVPKQGGELKGFKVLLPDIHSGPRGEEAMLIVPDGRSPYKPFSREKFLLARIANYDDELAKWDEGQQKLTSMRDAELARLEKRQLGDDAKAAELERLRKQYDTFDTNNAKRRDQLKGDKQKIQAAIGAMPAEEREAQAIVKDPYAMPDSGKLFASEANGGRALATIDRSSFEAQGDRGAIRMITIYWMWDQDIPTKVAVIKQFKENFDFAALAKMIGQ